MSEKWYKLDTQLYHSDVWPETAGAIQRRMTLPLILGDILKVHNVVNVFHCQIQDRPIYAVSQAQAYNGRSNVVCEQLFLLTCDRKYCYERDLLVIAKFLVLALMC